VGEGLSDFTARNGKLKKMKQEKRVTDFHSGKRDTLERIPLPLVGNI